MADAATKEKPIAFIDIAAQRARIADRIDAAIARVMEHGKYILGPEVHELECRLGRFCGAKHAVTCSSGTDALLLALMALGVGPGDAVLVPSFTFAASAEAVVLAGATPVFVDVDSATFNTDAASLERGIDAARRKDLTPRGVLAVDLFGQPADYDAIEAVAAAHGLWVVADAAQSFGAVYRGRPVGTIGRLTATSFFPAKPLGCFGDGGAILTKDDDLAATLRSLRVHGQGSDKYHNVRVGLNARLDTLQAAILLEKLTIFPSEIEARQGVAARYTEGLGDTVRVPRVVEGTTSVWAQYTVVVDRMNRDSLAGALEAAGVPTAIYYHKPLHRQVAYTDCPRADDLSVSEALSGRVLSLPMHPYLKAPVQDAIVAAVIAAHKA